MTIIEIIINQTKTPRHNTKVDPVNLFQLTVEEVAMLIPKGNMKDSTDSCSMMLWVLTATAPSRLANTVRISKALTHKYISWKI